MQPKTKTESGAATCLFAGCRYQNYSRLNFCGFSTDLNPPFTFSILFDHRVILSMGEPGYKYGNHQMYRRSAQIQHLSYFATIS
jgi:hypothetical protein